MSGSYRNLKLQGEKNEDWLMLWAHFWLEGPGSVALVIAALVATAASSF